jgi:hypothetical protein
MKPLEDGLERILEQGKLPAMDSELGQFLSAHPGAKQEVSEMIEISQMIRTHLSVSSDEEMAPAPGFYARVMARVEAEAAQQTFWSFFVDPLFGGRLVLASLSLVVLLLAANFLAINPEPEAEMAQSEISAPVDGPVLGAVLVSDGDELPVVESSDAEADRGAALVQLTTYDQ